MRTLGKGSVYLMKVDLEKLNYPKIRKMENIML
jgi:hypothetical protein